MVILNEVDEQKMFWGVSLDGGKRYTQIVETSFHISMAALEPTAGDVPKDKRYVSLWIQHEKAELLLCTLENHKTMQQPLDLNFTEGEEITLFTTGGNGTIHLSGYLVDEPDMQNEMDNFSEESSESEAEVPELLPLDDSLVQGKKRKMKEGNTKKKKQKVVLEEDFDSSDDEDDADYTLDDENMLSGDEDDDDEDDDDEDDDDDDDDDDDEDDDEDDDLDDEEEEDIKVEKEESPKKKKSNTTPSKPKETPKSKPNGTPAETQSNKKKKKKNKDQNTSINQQQEKKETPQKVNTPNKRVLAEGLVVEDIKVGNGPEAKSNKMVQMYYVGRLSSGKQFDSCCSGKPFKFRLGKREVIKGWDIGVQGMKVGGKRRLIVPPKLGYGNHKQGPIPGNSTLVFDVELKSVS